MKKIIALLLCLMLFAPAALAEFDTAPLKEDGELSVFTPYGTVDTVYRPVNQPYMGQPDEGMDGALDAFVDYITLVDAEVTLLRLVISTVSYDMPFNATEIRLTVGKKQYTFAVTHEESEYDGVYMEDYTTCLVGEGLNMLKTVAQQKTDEPVHVELLSLGDVVFSGLVIIPGEEAAQIYDRWIDLGGKQQALKLLEETWPCKAETVK